MILIAGEGGKTLTVPTGFDITDAATVRLRRQSPTGVASTIDMTVGATAIDVAGYGTLLAGYYAQYIIQTTDFWESGRWKLQLHVAMNTGALLKSEEVQINVGPSLTIVQVPATFPLGVVVTYADISGDTTIILPADDDSVQVLTMKATATITIPQGSFEGQQLTIIQRQDTTGGWTPTYVAGSGLTLHGTLPVPSLGAGRTDVLGFTYSDVVNIFLAGAIRNEL